VAQDSVQPDTQGCVLVNVVPCMYTCM
jgi:hypothetical protein